MPIKPLPDSLVLRMRRISQNWGQKNSRLKSSKPKDPRINFERLFDRLKIIDWRRKRQERKENTHLDDWGFRVREMDVSRNFPEIGKVVVKRIHAQETVPKITESLKNFLNDHLKNPAKTYSLIYPQFYQLNKNHLIMQRTNLPTLSEFFLSSANVSFSTFKFQTRKSKKFYKKLQKRNGFNDIEFISATQELHRRARTTKNTYRNFILIDYKKGQFVFMPLPDTT